MSSEMKEALQQYSRLNDLSEEERTELLEKVEIVKGKCSSVWDLAFNNLLNIGIEQDFSKAEEVFLAFNRIDTFIEKLAEMKFRIIKHTIKLGKETNEPTT